MLVIRGIDRVVGDLSSMGYDTKLGIIGAENAKLPHRRKRIWMLASNANNEYVERSIKKTILRFPGLQGIIHDGVDKDEHGLRSIFQSGLRRKFIGITNQVDRIKAIGNAQVPIVAATAFNILKEQ